MIPFSLLRLDHLVLRVSDLSRAINFYSDVLGSEVVRRREDLGLMHMRVGASMIDLISLSGPLGRKGGAGPGVEGRNVDHVCLRVEPFDQEAILEHLARLGILVEDIAKSNFGAESDGPSIYLTDPDGNSIELKGPAATSEGRAS